MGVTTRRGMMFEEQLKIEGGGDNDEGADF